MGKKISGIEIIFQTPVELETEHQHELRDIISKICKNYEAKNPARAMWLFGYGDKPLTNPFMVDEDHPMEFDENILFIECAEREKY